MQQTRPRLDVYVIEREHRSEAFVLLLTFNHKDASEYSKSIVQHKKKSSSYRSSVTVNDASGSFSI